MTNIGDMTSEERATARKRGEERYNQALQLFLKNESESIVTFFNSVPEKYKKLWLKNFNSKSKSSAVKLKC